VRLRPIIMTSLAFVFGVLPLVIAGGAGAEMRRSLGTAVFSGMIGVTAVGIFLTPVFFAVIEWMSESEWFATLRGRVSVRALFRGVANHRIVNAARQRLHASAKRR